MCSLGNRELKSNRQTFMMPFHQKSRTYRHRHRTYCCQRPPPACDFVRLMFDLLDQHHVTGIIDLNDFEIFCHQYVVFCRRTLVTFSEHEAWTKWTEY